MSEKTVNYPLPALLVLSFPFSAMQAGGHRKPYMDRAGVRAVTVLSVKGDKALVSFRAGDQEMREVHPIASLASTPEKAFALLQDQFAALLAIPALAAIAEAVAATPAPEPKPEPLAGPRPPRSHLPYVDN